MKGDFKASEIKIATFDLDGTVLHNGLLSKPVEASLRALSKMGIAVTVATGRDISQIPSSVLWLFDYRITNNGAFVSDSQGNAILDRPIATETAVQTLRLLRKSKGHCSLYFNGKVAATLPFLLRILTRTNFASKSHRASTSESRKGNSFVTLSLMRFMQKRGLSPYKIQTFFRNRTEATEALEKLNAQGLVNSVLSHDICLESMAEGVSKASGLLQLCRRLGCKTDNVISFGDSANDLDILKSSGFSVAMGNAEQIVKKNADYITESVADNGVAIAVEKLFKL